MGICDECGETRPVVQTIGDYGLSFGISHLSCRECYNSHPEPDTGRPDWEDFELVEAMPAQPQEVGV